MSVPDELVQAAAEALLRAGFIGDLNDVAGIAIQAAFAKLPECEAAKKTIASRVLWREHDHTTRPCCTKAILATLARELGG